MNSLFKLLGWVLVLVLAGVSLAHAERKTTYYHTDGLGSVIAASDETGTLLWRKEYAPYGQQLDSTAENEKLSYTGKQYDDVTGLSYFGARYYDPHLGRFMSVDPVSFVESNPMSFNRYVYVNNNPYKYVDPDGEFLNFAAKFVLDVGVNVAFNYVTTGSFGVGAALKESATGILNPAKTVAKVGKLAKVLAKAEKKLPDDAFVVRGGVTTPEQIAKGTGPHRDVEGLTGFSAQSRAGASVDELAATGGVGNKPFPNGQISVTTVGQLRCIGCEVVPSPGAGANHVTVVPGKATSAQISEQFSQRPNPSRAR